MGGSAPSADDARRGDRSAGALISGCIFGRLVHVKLPRSFDSQIPQANSVGLCGVMLPCKAHVVVPELRFLAVVDLPSFRYLAGIGVYLQLGIVNQVHLPTQLL